MIGQLFTVIAPVFVAAALGYGWARTGRAFDVEFVTALIASIGAPCLVFHSLANLAVGTDSFLEIAGAGLAVLAACVSLAAIVLYSARLSLRAYLPSLIFPNTGNMGLPLSYLAFGETGLGLAVVIFALTAVSQFTLGAAITAGSFSIRALVRVPLLWAVPPAFVFLALGRSPPEWVNATMKLIGSMTIPMMLITLGVSLAQLQVNSIPRSLALAVFRLVLGFGSALAIAELFGLEGAARGVLIVQSSMPVAVFNYLFAQRYRQAPEEVAGMILISTALSFLTLPFLLMLVL